MLEIALYIVFKFVLYLIRICYNTIQSATPTCVNETDDSDGIPDVWETKHHLNPYDAADAKSDSDRDGLNLLAEYENSSDPDSYDTDGDGLKDGEERNTYNTDPLITDGDGDEVNTYYTEPLVL